jgi:hypothetical protein
VSAQRVGDVRAAAFFNKLQVIGMPPSAGSAHC